MKKKVGELNGKSIVVGNDNEIAINEIHYSIDNNGVIILRERRNDGKLYSLTTPIIEDTPIVEQSPEIDEDPVEETPLKDVILNILLED